MEIEWLELEGFRNYAKAHIAFASKTLIIGANDVGKSNMLYALRLLLDRTLAEMSIEPLETDFHRGIQGTFSHKLSITVKLKQISEDAVISQLKGAVSDNGESVIRYEASRDTLDYTLFIGPSVESLEIIDGRHRYLKNIHFRFIQSSRDLSSFIRAERRNLLSFARKKREAKTIQEDKQKEEKIKDDIVSINSEVNSLSYIENASVEINNELSKLSYQNSDYKVAFKAQCADFSSFVEQLSLTASNNEQEVGLGGDGRNNQILLALWKTKAEFEIDKTSEAVIYCIEEPEAHLHPHQQRRFAKYLVDNLNGQVLVTSHSPQITEQFNPNNIVRIYNKDGYSVAASSGCSQIIKDAWDNFGYRMSIIPAEAFFADYVLLVEGPSERIFYNAIAKAQKIDLDFLNISILSVDGVSFDVYKKILDAMEIRHVIRTDNDIVLVPCHSDQWQLLGLNRALALNGEEKLPSIMGINKPLYQDVNAKYEDKIRDLRNAGIYLSKVDLETDLADAFPDLVKNFAGEDNIDKAIDYLKGSKAIRMREFVSRYQSELESNRMWSNALFEPLFFLNNAIRQGIH